MFRKKQQRPVRFKEEEVTPEDITYRDEFTTSRACKSIEKMIGNRICQKNSEAIDYITRGDKHKAAIAAGKIEELNDLLLEWENAREDLKKRLVDKNISHDAV